MKLESKKPEQYSETSYNLVIFKACPCGNTAGIPILEFPNRLFKRNKPLIELFKAIGIK